MSAKKAKKTELEKRLEEAAAKEREQAEGAPAEDAHAAPETAADERGEEVDVDALIAERDELNDQVLRARAEFENYRKRVARENDRLRRTAAQDLMRDLLPVLDNLERALDHADDDAPATAGASGFVEGVRMVLKQMCDVLARHGLESIPSLGEPFDPNVHEAMAVMPSDEHPADHVVNEFQRGYRLGEFVLRPAKVVVNAAPPPPETPGAPTETEAPEHEAEQVATEQ